MRPLPRPRHAALVVSPLAVALLGAGCVSQDQYDSALKDLDSARSAQTQSQQALETCQKNLAEADSAFEAKLAEELAASKAELEELRKAREAAEQRAAAFNQLQDKLSELIASGDLEVYIRNGLPVIALPSGVLFRSGKAELQERGEKSLKKVGSTLADMKGQRIQVAGHTDNVPMGKKLDWEDNWELSSARALTVTRFLIDNGVPPDNLSAAGYSEYDPVASNDSGKGRKKNRRIELVLLPDLSDIEQAVKDDAG